MDHRGFAAGRRRLLHPLDIPGAFAVNFAFSPEQEAFRQSLRRFLADKSPAAEVRRLMETDAGYDPQVWKQLADQLGLLGLAIPEEFGGAGRCCALRSSPRWGWPPRRCWRPATIRPSGSTCRGSPTARCWRRWR